MAKSPVSTDVTRTNRGATPGRGRKPPKRVVIQLSRQEMEDPASILAAVREGVKAVGVTLVVRDKADAAARRLTEDEPVTLTRKQVAHVFETLDHPPAASVAAVRKLLAERSVLDG